MADQGAPRKHCFVIGPIGEANTPARNNADMLMAYVIRPALEPRYDVTRADDISKPGMVDDQVIIRIKQADLIVVDLHGENPNAYYEVGVAHCFRKKTIHLIAKGATIPFDLHGYRTIFYGLSNPKEHAEARAEVDKHAVALEVRDVTISNPVTRALGMFEVEQTGDTRDRMMSQMDASLQQIRAEVASLQQKNSVQEMMRAFVVNNEVMGYPPGSRVIGENAYSLYSLPYPRSNVFGPGLLYSFGDTPLPLRAAPENQQRNEPTPKKRPRRQK